MVGFSRHGFRDGSVVERRKREFFHRLNTVIPQGSLEHHLVVDDRWSYGLVRGTSYRGISIVPIAIGLVGIDIDLYVFCRGY
jgi:hypothetical protein